jgi:hypothetical protein
MAVLLPFISKVCQVNGRIRRAWIQNFRASHLRLRMEFLPLFVNFEGGQPNRLNRRMHQSVEMPSRQVIFLPSE